ncbi:unnamed protein product [Thelazia callipaeda]|uniref:3-hydroxy-3-methylglutaryl coenzyme A reductase n=1 Tax=Thelazia callipaeda TaxID=103827 RepID=A0A0N5CQQ9_THECL|nr:unnamed protein product [Thelazia callipaeda]
MECLEWEDNFVVDEEWLARKINDVVVDEEDQWRTKLLKEIAYEISKHCKLRSMPCKTTAIQSLENSVIKNIDRPAKEINIYSKTKLEATSSASKIKNRNKNDGNEVVTTLVKNLKSGKPVHCYPYLDDREIIQLLNFGHVKQRDLEVELGGDLLRAISIRRLYLSEMADISLSNLPFQTYDYNYVIDSCCENVIGYVPIPTGFVGPLLMNGRKFFVPMSTTEGALIASTSRGCRAIYESGGVVARVYKDGMTRAPVVQFTNILRALEVKNILDSRSSFEEIKKVFDSTSSFAKLQQLEVDISGRLLFLRFEATTGDAMGMNMVSKGVHAALSYLKEKYPDMEMLSLSGNYCVDKKASALNWIKGRGKSVIAEAKIPMTVVQTILKTTVDALVRLGQAKLLIGSSMSGTIGGWNAHAANVVAAIFIATGQDVAQVVSSSMCLTSMEKTEHGDLYVSCNMRCLEVGTVGGGTILPAQKTCLKMLGCGSPTSIPSESASRLAEIICSTVLAGELSLMAAQCSNDLVRSHIKLNRSSRCLHTATNSAAVHLGKIICNKDDDQSKLRMICALRKHSISEKSIEFEMQCSNIL